MTVALAIVACGSFGEAPADAEAGTQDGTTVDGGGLESSTDASTDEPRRAPIEAGPRCPIGAPFKTLSAVPLEGEFSVEAARFTPDQTAAYLSLCPATGDKKSCELYVSLLTPSGAFGTPQRISVSATNAYDSYPSLAADGRFIVFSSDRSGGPRIYSAEATSGGYAAPVVLAVPSGLAFSNEPYLLANGRTMYFASANANGVDWDLFRAEGVPPLYAAGSGRLLTNVTPDEEFAPVVAEDEREMFWASNRADPAKKGDLDIWTAERAANDPTYQFGQEAIVPVLGTAGIDYPTWLSPDACDLYLIQKTGPRGALVVAHRR